MSEAWLLIDRDAICRAADNPHSKAKIVLPDLKRLPGLPDPKKVLFDLLLEASESKGRRRQKFQARLHYCRGRVVDFIEDFSSLRSLAAFAEFEEATTKVLEQVRLDE